MSNATKAQTKASEAYVEAIDKRVDSELAESHNAQRQSFWKDQKSRRILGDVLTYVLLTVLGIIWLLPIVWIFLESLNKNTAPFTDTFFPTQYSFDSYVTLFTQRNVLDFPRMFMNTFIIAVFTCIISVFFVLSVAYVMSRMRFHGRRFFMNFVLILVYSAGTGAGFYVMKGYMDTIPTSLDEAAMLDGCTRWQVFWIIIVPICRPMIVYQAIVGFLTPWLDFVMAKVIARTQENYTASLGLWLMLDKEYINNWFGRFAAAAVLISIPIAILFIVMQRFYQESMSGSVKG